MELRSNPFGHRGLGTREQDFLFSSAVICASYRRLTIIVGLLILVLKLLINYGF
jgi:hypothetical protein